MYFNTTLVTINQKTKTSKKQKKNYFNTTLVTINLFGKINSKWSKQYFNTTLVTINRDSGILVIGATNISIQHLLLLISHRGI